MTRALFLRGLVGWAGLTVLLALAAHMRMDIDERSVPSNELSSWALARLAGATSEPAPGAWEGEGPTVVIAWRDGYVMERFVGTEDLVATVLDAHTHFEDLQEEPAEYTVEVVLGTGPLALSLPFIRELSIVPMHEGLWARVDEKSAILTPEELVNDRGYDTGVSTFIPDLAFGADVLSLIGRLARDVGSDRDSVLERGELLRTRSHTIRESVYPREQDVTEENLRAAAVEGADFLLRHQQRNGMYTYIYEAAGGRTNQAGYNLPRHAGTSYFLAQVDRLHGHPPARAGALRALRWLESHHIEECGETMCVVHFGRADVGSAALTVVAAAELLTKEEDPLARRLVEGLSAFLRAQQREDGELMHEYDLDAQAPIDVQHLYYSGEAAFALLKAHEATGDEENLHAAQRLMTHLTGSGWDFFGSRYYYGEEHWTCIAAGEARDRGASDEAVDFCRRWYEWNDVLQFRDGETPWPVEGGYGVGPLILPRLTPVGSRTEAFIGTYELMSARGLDTDGVRAVVERGLGQLLRWRWSPGPTHLFADPAAAFGGIPETMVNLDSRNDFVQHAGSAWIRWADVLRREREEAVDEPSSP